MYFRSCVLYKLANRQLYAFNACICYVCIIVYQVLTLAGIIKDIMLVVLSIVVFGSPVSPSDPICTLPKRVWVVNFVNGRSLRCSMPAMEWLCSDSTCTKSTRRIRYTHHPSSFVSLLYDVLSMMYLWMQERIAQLIAYMLSCGNSGK